MKMYIDPSLITRVCTSLFLVCGLVLPFSLQADEWSDPCCSIPHDVITSCDDLPGGFDPNNWDLLEDLFGEPNGYYHCDNQNWHELAPEVSLDHCGIGTINRRFKAYYQSGGWGSPTEVTCEQTITIAPSHEYVVRFPPDAVAYCEEPEAEDIQFEEESCDLLAISKEDLKFQTGSDACYKILRTYRVINWCEYDGHSDPIIIGRDEDCDNVPGDEAVWVIRRPDNKIYIDRTDNEHDYYPSADELDPSCGHTGHAGFWRKIWLSSGSSYNDNRGFYQYTQHLKVMDNIAPEVAVTNPDPFCSYSEDQGEGCPGEISFSFSVSDECSATASVKVFLLENNESIPFTSANNIASEVLSGTYPDYTITQYLPLGNHTYEIHVKDGCGTSNAIRVPVEVVDCDPPSLICLHGLSTSLMPLEANTDIDGDGDIDAGAMEIWASDFIVDGYSDDCTGPISYSINRVGETPDIDNTALIFTCEDGVEVEVEIYVWDSADNPYQVQPDGTVGGPNFDLCRTYIKLNRNDLCGDLDEDAVTDEEEEEEEEEVVTEDPVEGMARLAGMIYTTEGERLMNTEVQLSGLMVDTMVIDTIVMDTMMMDTLMTDTLGAYRYQQAQLGGTYELRPFRDGDDLNGINASDMTRLNNHLLGRDPFTSPFQLIAADLNNSGTVDSDDLTILLKIMLGVTTSLEETPSWRFVDAAYTFPNTENPWEEAFPESIQINSILSNQDSLEFYAIKMGDLNFSAALDPNSFDQRGNETVTLLTQVADIRAGETFTVNISGEQPGMLGGQLSFSYDPGLIEPVELVSDFPSFMEVDADLGLIKLALLPNRTLEESTDWFSLRFESKYTGKLERALQLDLNSNNELIGQDYASYPVHLQFETASPENWLIRANYPNPFHEVTYFDLNLPKSGQFSLEVFNMAGQSVFTQSQQLGAGQHQIPVKAESLKGEGLLWYRIQLDGEVKSGKMILLD